jgi:calpain
LNVNSRDVRLIRLRNPWGRVEWKGAWSDHSVDWQFVSPHIKNSLEFKIENEGEFWMCFEDFYHFFDSIQFCHLTPESYSDQVLKPTRNEHISWKLLAYHGEWRRNVSAGGSGNNGDRRYWMNSQFLIKLVDVDLNDDNNMATMIVALMQKYTRERRVRHNGEAAEEFIQFRVYRIVDERDAEDSVRNGTKLSENQLERVGNSGQLLADYH